ncbi:hypothetical protein BDZ91DRAFT_722987 [Kalaharituber pfeilii]|nr:hypothetical protein BDZ91DRAFT_722987 [Kalaharituber pfeilii]
MLVFSSLVRQANTGRFLPRILLLLTTTLPESLLFDIMSQISLINAFSKALVAVNLMMILWAREQRSAVRSRTPHISFHYPNYPKPSGHRSLDCKSR